MVGVKEQPACKDCTLKCLRIHGKTYNKELPSLDYFPPMLPAPKFFFKIMIGDFREALTIPPMMCSTLEGLLNQDCYLEDSDGLTWKVRISQLNSSMALRQGWREFVLDHSIEVGELVVFKYVGGARFHAQIFGTSACERIHFEKKSRHNHNWERNESEKCYKDVYLDKCFSFDDPVKKEKTDYTNGFDVFGSESSLSNFAGIVVAEDESRPKKTQFCHVASAPKPLFKLSYTRAKQDMIDEDAKRDKEATKIHSKVSGKALYNVVHKQSENENEAIEECGIHKLKHKKSDKRSLAVKRKRLALRNKRLSVPGGSLLSQPEQIAEFTNCDIQNLSTVELFKGNSEIQLLANLDMLDRNEKTQPNNGMNPLLFHDINAIAIESIKRNPILPSDALFLLTEKGICHIIDPDMIDQLATTRLTPIDFAISEDENVRQGGQIAIPGEALVDKENSEGFCTAPTQGCHEYGKESHRPLAEERSRNPETKRKLDPLGSALGYVSDRNYTMVGTANLTKTGELEKNKDHNATEGQVPGAFVEELEENANPCVRGDEFIMNPERMDSVELPPPKGVHFRFSSAVDLQPWLELPEKLPSSLGRKRLNKKVVLLRDPSMKLWPVLYTEDRKAAYFIGGWKDFTTANKLQQGDACEFALIESGSTFQVTITKA